MAPVPGHPQDETSTATAGELDNLRALMARVATASGPADTTAPAVDPHEERARKWVVAATSKRPLSEREAEEKLTAWLEKRDLPTAHVPSVIAWATAEGLLDDQAFANLWVANRGVARGYGRRRLTQELQKRKIASQYIDEALTQLDTVDEYEQARALAGQRHLRYDPAEDPRRVATKLVNFLMRRGFDAGIAHRAALSVTRAHEAWD